MFDLKTDLITSEQVRIYLPERKPDGHKGTFGRVYLLAGSTGLTGAAALAALSALRSGCGLAKIGCPASTLPLIVSRVTEATSHPLPDVKKKGALALRGLGEIRTEIKQHDAVIIGPGIGQHHETKESIQRLVKNLDKPAIIDADGLNALVGHTDLLKKCPSPLVLTPHPGEFQRLTNGAVIPSDIHEKINTAIGFAVEHNVTLVLKGSPTLVADKDGSCHLNPTGNHGMATGGSGDVLSGIIGTFLAQGMSGREAASTAVYIHGLAGDLAADDFTSRAMIAGDMIDYLGEAFAIIEG